MSLKGKGKRADLQLLMAWREKEEEMTRLFYKKQAKNVE